MPSNELLRLLDAHLDDDAWPGAPSESEPSYFATWQHVSVALQKALRRWVPEFYFRDLGCFENRDAGYTMVVYSACRLFYGRPGTEFTYDIADETTLAAAVRAIGCGIERTLAPLEARLDASGRAELGRQYSPLWYQDVLVAVKKRPQRLLTLLAREAKLIDAVIDLGARHNRAGARQLAKRSNSALRNLLGVDMRDLLPQILNEVAIVLAEQRRVFTPSMAIDSQPSPSGRRLPAGRLIPALTGGV